MDFKSSTQEQAKNTSRQTLEADNKDLKERVLRSLAEVENMRTRAERNVADARAHGHQKFAESLLEVRC